MSDVPQPESPRARSREKAFRFNVEPEEDGMRLDRFLAERLRGHGLSREKIKTLIRGGKAAINDAPAKNAKDALAGGSAVCLLVPPPESPLTPEQGDLRILYRDAVLAALDKAAGLTVHPAPGRPTGTLAHRLLHHFPELASQEGFRPGIVHRLDKDTSGLMLAALTEECRLALAALFAGREVYKEYLALVHGVPDWTETLIEEPVGRDPGNKTKMTVTPHGKAAQSLARVLHADPGGVFSLVAVRIFSGRTHQVRVHLRHVGHPLWGDALYQTPASRNATRARKAKGTPDRQMLHAWKLAFRHPLPEKAGEPELTGAASAENGRLTLLCPPPPDFPAAAASLAARTLHVVVTGLPGCGKSSLLRHLEDAGLPAFSADAEVARLYAPRGDAALLLRGRFGARFVPDADAAVDKAALGAAMRNDEALRREVEDMVHPLVWHAFETFRTAQEAACRPLSAAEIPLYLESGRRGRDAADPPLLVGVRCPFAIRKERLARTRGWSESAIAAMEAWQWPEEKKMAACDIVVDNSGTPEVLAGEAAALLKRLRGIRHEREEALLAKLEDLWNPDGL